MKVQFVLTIIMQQLTKFPAKFLHITFTILHAHQ